MTIDELFEMVVRHVTDTQWTAEMFGGPLDGRMAVVPDIKPYIQMGVELHVGFNVQIVYERLDGVYIDTLHRSLPYTYSRELSREATRRMKENQDAVDRPSN